MYIQPNTNIRILKDVPLDTTYDHSIFFSSVSDQTNYFISKQKYNLSNYSYQRVNNGYMRVGIVSDNLYDCNYLMFQNTSFGNKWFYAFITEVNYINNDVTEIKFEIDDMQTWFFDFTFEKCFVEREHTLTDEMFEHYEAEPIQVSSDYIHMDSKYVHEQDLIYCMMYTNGDNEWDDNGVVTNSRVYDNVYTGWSIYLTNDKQTLDDKIGTLVSSQGGADRIRSIYMIPNPQRIIEGNDWVDLTDAVLRSGIDVQGGNTGLNKNTELDNTHLHHPTEETLLAITSVEEGQSVGYEPRNKKLYCYPFHFYNVSNNAGQSLCLRYELFYNNQVQLHVNSGLLQPVQENLFPVGYKGTNVSSLDIEGDTNEMLTIVNFPTCNWSFDAYTAWLNNDFVPLAIGTAGTVIGGGLGVAMNPLTAPSYATNLVGQVTNLLQANYRASIQADITKGNINTGGVTSAMKLKTFVESRCSLPAQELAIIDDYFDRFGYCVKRLKEPKLDNRPHWTYVKTIGCNINGSMPSDSQRHICQIFDNGITFWKDGAEVGHYELNNAPV